MAIVIVTLAVCGFALAIIVDMDQGSASQGGRYFIAVLAVFVLGSILSFISRSRGSDESSSDALLTLAALAFATAILVGSAWVLR